MFFHDLKGFTLSPSAATVPDISVTTYHVCGRVDSGMIVRDREVSLTGGQIKLTTTAVCVRDLVVDVRAY